MNQHHHSRASDLGPILTQGTNGFVLRKRPGVGVAFSAFMMLSMVMLGTSLLVYHKSPEGCILAIAIGASLGMVSHSLEHAKKAQLSLEFINALFSSVMGKGYAFCCIVKQSGEIVFYNRPFQAVFAAFMEQPARTLAALLAHHNIPDADREKLQALMAENQEGSFETSLRSHAESEARSIMFVLEPIERPTGFFLLRGK